MKLAGEKFYLLFLSLRVRARKMREERAIRRAFYSHPFFRSCDQAFLKAYQNVDPFRISKEYLIAKGAEEIYVYGETPIRVWNEIAKRTTLTSSDRVIDLGCGAARGLFFLASYYGCSVVGVDWISEFVERAQKISAQVGLNERATFYTQEIVNAPLENATLIYLYGTCLEDELILQLIESFKRLAPGVRIVTVSFSLNEYCQPNFFSVKEVFEALFPWGRATVFIQEKV
jgi:SAM-dependent methyltransferase